MKRLPLFKHQERLFALVECNTKFNECAVCALGELCDEHTERHCGHYLALCNQFLADNKVPIWKVKQVLFVDVTKGTDL